MALFLAQTAFAFQTNRKRFHATRFHHWLEPHRGSTIRIDTNNSGAHRIFVIFVNRPELIIFAGTGGRQTANSNHADLAIRFPRYYCPGTGGAPSAGASAAKFAPAN